MPIVITPSGEYVDDQTGMPVDPRMIQQLDPRSSARQGEMMGGVSLDPRSAVREGEMARENIPPNLDMGMDSMMPQNIDPRSVVREGERAAAELSDVDKVRMLIDMGLNPQEAMEVIAREKALSPVRPEEFGAETGSGMGALSGVPEGGQAPMPMPTPRPEDLMQRQMPMGRDRTFNPRDAINPFNAPST